MDKRSIPLPDLIRIFDTYNRSEGKSQPKLKWYRETLNILLRWLVENKRLLEIGWISEFTIREFVLFFQELTVCGHKMQVSSVNNRVRVLRSFFNWLYREQYTPTTHVLLGLKPAKLPELIIEILEEDEIARILACIDRSTANGARDAAMIALSLDTGNRLSELIYLKLVNIHLEEQYIKVFGKGSKERMISLSSTTRSILLNY